jgi:nucleotide-binding universal stress UspA family protein
MYRSILVATDGSETSAEAVQVATELAKTFGATLHIASVYHSDASSAAVWAGVGIAFPEGADPRSFAETQTEEMASRARAKGVSTQTHVTTGLVVERILAVAVEQNVELIVVGNKGMRGLRRVLGSVPNAIAHSAPCSVLIVNTT